MSGCCDRTLEHETPAECWTSGLRLPQLSAFVDLDRALAPAEPFGASAPALDLEGMSTVAHTIAISPLMALDYNLLEPGTPAHTAAVEQRARLDARADAWNRSWEGRRARARAQLHRASHAARHRLAQLLDPGCLARADDW